MQRKKFALGSLSPNSSDESGTGSFILPAVFKSLPLYGPEGTARYLSWINYIMGIVQTDWSCLDLPRLLIGDQECEKVVVNRFPSGVLVLLAVHEVLLQSLPLLLQYQTWNHDSLLVRGKNESSLADYVVDIPTYYRRDSGANKYVTWTKYIYIFHTTDTVMVLNIPFRFTVGYLHY